MNPGNIPFGNRLGRVWGFEGLLAQTFKFVNSEKWGWVQLDVGSGYGIRVQVSKYCIVRYLGIGRRELVRALENYSSRDL